jgi:hypothetical protein
MQKKNNTTVFINCTCCGYGAAGTRLYAAAQPPSSPHIEFNWTPSEEFEAGIKHGVDQYLKEHPLDLNEK